MYVTVLSTAKQNTIGQTTICSHVKTQAEIHTTGFTIEGHGKYSLNQK